MDTLPFLALVVVAVAAAFVGGVWLQNSLEADQPVVYSSDPNADPTRAPDHLGNGGGEPGGGAAG